MQLNLLSAGTLLRFFRLSPVVSSCALLACACLPFAVPCAAQSQSSDAAARVTLETLSPTALSSAVDAGPIPTSQLLTLTITLAPTPARAAALNQYLTELQTATSPSYRKWVTPAAFASAYGATPDQLAAATEWAQTAGLTITATSPSGTRMTVTGYPAQVEAALAVGIHQYQLAGHTYFANATQPSLPSALASLFTSIEGLDNLPGDLQTYSKGPGTAPGTLVNGTPTPLTIASLAPFVDQNITPILTLDATSATGSFSTSRLAAYEALFQQAAAEGITTLLTRTASSQGFPSGLPEVTAVANPGDSADTQPPTFARPDWQSAPGLPSDALRHAPDLTAASVSALASTLSSLAIKLPADRLGNINPILYELAPTPELYTQPSSAPAGTWEASTGLGLVNLAELARAFPLGTGSSFTSFAASNYSPVHGQSITFTSNVTSGTGGGAPTGTVAFVTSAGVTLGTSSLVGGTATYSTNQLAGGSYTVQANYSGDGTYAASSSAAGTVFVQPEASQLAAKVSTGSTFGTTYTVVVTDTAGSGVGFPTGNATLTIEGPGTNFTQALAQSSTDSSLTTFTIPANTVGTQTLSINCAGDASYSCYNPITTTVTIAKATPTLSISYSPNPPVSGQTISLNATVTGVPNATVPTGSVTFFDNATTLNSANLVNGTVTETGIVPSTSTHNITATYNGDANYSTANSTGSSSTGNGTATLAASLSSSSGAPNSTIIVSTSVTIPGAMAAPTGSVVATLTLPSGPSIATGTLVATGTTTATGSISVVLPTTPGTYPLAISCAGTDSFTCNTVNFSVTTTTSGGTVASSTVITSSSYATTYGQSFTLSAAVKSAASGTTTTPTGSVTFTSATLGTIATVPLTNGLASYAVTSGPAAGSYSFNAVYSGDSTFAASTGSSSSVTISPSVATITASVNPTSVGTGTSTTVSATVMIPGSTVPPTGNVTVTVPGVSGAVYSGALTTTGTNAASVNIAVPAPSAGTYQLEVTCGGSASFSCTPTTVTLVSTAAAKIVTTTAVAASSYAITTAQSVTLMATVSPSSTVSSAPSGTVTFYGATQGLLGSASVLNGSATLALSSLPSGSYTITADYSGDANYASSAGSAPSPLSVTGSSTTTSATLAATLSASSATAGTTVNVLATVTLTGTAPPAGEIIVTVGNPGSTTNAAGTLVSSGTNTATVTIPVTVPATAGAYPVVVSCPTTDTFTCNTVSFTLTSVAAAKIVTTTTLTATPAAPQSGQTVTLTATVTSASLGAAPISGTVTFYQGTTQIGSGIVANGVATTTFTLTGTSPATLTAVYSGDTNYATSTSAALALTPALAPVSVVLSVTGSAGIAGSPVTLVATVNGIVSSGAAPTGTVSFYIAGTAPVLIGTATLTSNLPGTSTATLTTSSIPAGTQSIYAVYSGDTNFAPGVSSSVSVGLTDYAVVFTPPNITLTPGETGTVVLQVNAIAGFTGTIAIGCTPPPDTLITCSLSQTALTGGGTSVLTISTVAAPVAETHTPGFKTVAGVSLAALLCFLLPGRNRRRLPGLLLALVALALSVNLAGCSTNVVGTPVGGGTPLGTVNLTINTAASNGSTGIAHDYSYQVTIIQ
jgi:hypothetical protein